MASRIADRGEFAAALRLLLDHVVDLSDRSGSKFPMYRHDDGTWYLSADGNWMSGHWIGLLMLAAKHARTADEQQRLEAVARERTASMLTQPTNNVFAGMNHLYAGFFAAELLPDPERTAIGLRGADAMVGLYRGDAQQIVIGPYACEPIQPVSADNPSVAEMLKIAAVDVIHTSVPILWAAASITGDARYWDVADAHSRRHLEWHMRSDGSTVQLTFFDDDGNETRTANPLGLNENSCWTRGLAWNIAGLAESYTATGDEAYLTALERSVAYFTARAPDGIPAWDLDVTDPRAPRDSSAAAIIAHGLVGLAGATERERALRAVGLEVLTAIIDRCQVTDPADPEYGGIAHSCYWHLFDVGVDTEMITTDFYTAAALHIMTERDP